MPSSIASSTKPVARHGKPRRGAVKSESDSDSSDDLAAHMQRLRLERAKLTNDRAIPTVKVEVKKEQMSETSSVTTAALMSPSTRSISELSTGSGSTQTFSVASSTATVKGSQSREITGHGRDALASIVPNRHSFPSGANRMISSKSSVAESSNSDDTASQILDDFFADTVAYVASGGGALSGMKAQKLALWQAILIRLGVCLTAQGRNQMTPGVARPTFYPGKMLPLPTSLTGCKSLIKKYVFVNIVNFQKSQNGSEKLLLFASSKQVAKYTAKYHRYAKLGRSKEAFLQPLLRNIIYKPTKHHSVGRSNLARQYDDDSDEDTEVGSDSEHDSYSD